MSLHAQRGNVGKVEAWCLANDYELAHGFVDAGISGKQVDNRLALNDASAGADNGDTIIVYSLSRLSRSTKDTLAIAERIEKTGADLVSLSEKIVTTTNFHIC